MRLKNTKHITFCVPPVMFGRMLELAGREKMTISEYLRAIIKERIKKDMTDVIPKT